MAQQNPQTETVHVTTTAKGITTITLSRPSRRNAVNTPTAHKLYQAFVAFDQDDSQKVCVFHGAGGNFCAGFDLHEVSDPGRSSSPAAAPVSIGDPTRAVNGQTPGPMGPSRLSMSKPVIAAVAGYAVAGGLELSLLADLRVVEEGAVFGVFCRRWGVPLIDGGTVRLQAIVGLGRALDMILTGRPVNAREAYEMGLANRVVPNGTALEEATRLAESLLCFPQECMKADRSSCYYSAYGAVSFEDALRREFHVGSAVVESEGVKGASSFSSGKGRGGSFKL